MNIPLTWLSDYVTLPKSTKELTDKLTMVGHMLDKIKEVNDEAVIDLELRGNRADMFGLIGVARDISACFDTKLNLPEVAKLPKTDPNISLLSIDKSIGKLVKRYIAIKLSVKVGPSPKWLKDRLETYGIPSVNNIVDVTNYVMVETSHPMHAFDADKINGGKLILRKAKENEKFETIQQGTILSLSKDDFVVSDTKRVHCLNIIGGHISGVSNTTKNIILESAVYDSANCRRTARRLKVFTEGGSRHEKHQDPEGVYFTLARATYLMQQVAGAKILGEVSDYYPEPIKPKVIDFDYSEVSRLSGMEVPTDDAKKILRALGFQVGVNITVPTFRTDILQSADIVEEVVRLAGYDKIPETPLSGTMPSPQTYESFSLQEKVRDFLVSLGLKETITMTIVENGTVKLTNPPDPDKAYLRSEIRQDLISSAKKLVYRKQRYARVFEVGKVFKKSKDYSEHLNLAICCCDEEDIYTFKGIIQMFNSLLGKSLSFTFGKEDNIFWAEACLDSLVGKVPQYVDVYDTVSKYSPIIEDVNVKLTGDYENLVKKIMSFSKLINKIDFVDVYEGKLTLRLTFHDKNKQLSTADIAPIRELVLRNLC